MSQTKILSKARWLQEEKKRKKKSSSSEASDGYTKLARALIDGAGKGRKRVAVIAAKRKKIIRARRRSVVAVDKGGKSALERAMEAGWGEPRKLKAYELDDGISQSILGCFLGCRMKMEYVLNGWYLPRTKAAMTFGSMFHHLLEKLYDWIIEDGDVYEGIDFRIWARGQLKQWIKEHAKEFGTPSARSMAKRQAAIASVVFEAYTDHYAKKDFQKIKWRALEGVFDVNWRGFRLRGRWDGVLERKNKLWLLETKTKGRWDAEKLKTKVAFDFQSLYYLTALAASGLFKKEIAGVVYNIIRNPQLRQGEKESDRAFLTRIGEDAHKPNRQKHYFQRYEISFSKKVRENFERELYMKLTEFKAWMLGLLPTFKREAACVGNYTCDYLGACASSSMGGFLDGGVMFRELL